MLIKDKIYGDIEIKDELAEEIIKTEAMQRLKGIGQYSTYSMVSPKFNTSRFEHSVGAYILLKKLGAPYEEQIAGLIHDISHTAFSHLIDFIYDRGQVQDVHDKFQEEIIKKSAIPLILKKFKIDVDYVLNESNFPLLEKEIPEVCADRIDYFIRDSFTVGIIDFRKAQQYIKALSVLDNEIIIKNRFLAEEIAKNFMKMNLNFWANSFMAGSLNLAAETLRLALKEGIIGEKDFFLTDDELLDRLRNSGNALLLKNLGLIAKPSSFLEGSQESYDILGVLKARYIDPKFLNNGKIMKLSNAEPSFKKKIEDFKKLYKEGFYIKLRGGLERV